MNASWNDSTPHSWNHQVWEKQWGKKDLHSDEQKLQTLNLVVDYEEPWKLWINRRDEAICRREQEEDRSAEKATENDQEVRKTEIEIEFSQEQLQNYARKIMRRIINEDDWFTKKMKEERERQRKRLEKVVMDCNNLLLEGQENWYHIKKEKVNVEMIFSLLANEGT